MKTHHSKFLTRTLTTYRHMTTRFAEKKDKNGRVTRYRRQIPFTLEEFRAWVRIQFGGEDGLVKCPYCGVFVDILNFTTDHKTPVSRGGSLDLDNLAVCDDTCNRIKGKLTVPEYVALRRGLESFAESGRNDIYNRLKTGAGFTRIRFIKPKPAGAAAPRRPHQRRIFNGYRSRKEPRHTPGH